MENLLKQIGECKVCESSLPHGCRPVLQASRHSKIAIIGQAPGRVVHASGIPWDDKSGDNLRAWLGVTKAEFYNPDLFALIPMGFCYPGTGKSGDLAPRKECAPLWHEELMNRMPDIELFLLFGQYSQKYYLKDRLSSNLTETVKNYKQYLPQYLPLPHPSPRNNIWLKKNEWFALELLPELRSLVKAAMP